MRIPASVKILSVIIVAALITYSNYIFINYYFPFIKIKNTDIFVAGYVLYPMVIFFFAEHYIRRKEWVKLLSWLFVIVALTTNFVMRMNEVYPHIYIQYSQSTSMLIYGAVMLFSKGSKPNWERIFAITILIILIPCLFFYFTESWLYYEWTVYLLGITPVINSMVFLEKHNPFEDEIIA